MLMGMWGFGKWIALDFSVPMNENEQFGAA